MTLSFASRFRSFLCRVDGCGKVCRSLRGLKNHQNVAHPILSSDNSDNEAQVQLKKSLVHAHLEGETYILLRLG